MCNISMSRCVIFGTASGPRMQEPVWPDWANFRPKGDCLIWADFENNARSPNYGPIFSAVIITFLVWQQTDWAGSRYGSAVKWRKWENKWNGEDPGLLPTVPRATSLKNGLGCTLGHTPGNLLKKRIGLHFGQFSNKLIRSPCPEPKKIV
jgi:hypothetical protein